MAVGPTVKPPDLLLRHMGRRGPTQRFPNSRRGPTQRFPNSFYPTPYIQKLILYTNVSITDATFSHTMETCVYIYFVSIKKQMDSLHMFSVFYVYLF
jgi:hypothetical protein